ncbi:expressed unknown protein [Seminavis robusta]|uniref:peptidylprolyl isomerase n=1 Tax=Seminavis robusta TaxID=568900 RepID=A0A9N8E8D6_9STRA|nr:expressed unknown protein [Seminavis robusta]|eukprot:Sro734_g194620.1 n/a (557) ;mRNA; r:4276-5946
MTVLGVVENLVEASAETDTDETLKKTTNQEDVSSAADAVSSTPQQEEEAEETGEAESPPSEEPKEKEEIVDKENEPKSTVASTISSSDDDEYEYEGRYGRLREDADQALVSTPYGRGLVIRTRKNPSSGKVVSRDIEMMDWKMAQPKRGPPQKAMLYTAEPFPSVAPNVGDDVKCQFGRGKIVELTDDRVKVELSSWRLAGRSKVHCYLSRSGVQVLRPKLVYEMNVGERVAHAQQLKEQARVAFGQKDYERALTKYALAVDAVRYVQHDKQSTNYLRADLLVIMITCCNNAATCCAQQKQWDQVARYANNALLLIQSLQDRQSKNEDPSKIMQVLTRDGMDDVKIFGEWKCKSLLLLAKTEQARENYTKALGHCKTAHDIVTKDFEESKSKVLSMQKKEISRIHAAAKEGKQKLHKKEKQRAQAMFGGSSKSEKEDGGAVKTNSGSPAKAATTATTTSPKEKDVSKTPRTKQPTTNNNNGPKFRRTVTFEDGGKPSDEYENKKKSNNDDDEEEEDVELPWYQEHQELLILVGGLAFFGVLLQAMLTRSGKRTRSS